MLVCDQVLDPDPARGRPTDFLTDMQMMAMFGHARERTEEEFRRLLGDARFDLRRVIPMQSPVSIVEAVAA